jgi:protein-ribulosamine 3-kinase
MAPNAAVDPAIIKALGLDTSRTKITSHGGSGFASTFKLSTTIEGQPVDFFVKTGSGKNSEIMFRGKLLTLPNVHTRTSIEQCLEANDEPFLKGEHASLNAIHNAVPNFCPRSHAHGPMSSANKHFLATDFLDLGAAVSPGGGGSSGPPLSLAAKLAKLHTTPAPIPAGYDRPMFGFPVATCCGETPQENSWKASWADFYAENRLRSILRRCIENNGPDADMEATVEKTASKVVTRLIGDDTLKGGITPVVVHGDLWSGNHSRGQIAGTGPVEEVVYDPSAVYGHAEYELGIMKMFGGFGSGFWREYENLVPRAEPKAEWEDRVLLYEL